MEGRVSERETEKTHSKAEVSKVILGVDTVNRDTTQARESTSINDCGHIWWSA